MNGQPTKTEDLGGGWYASAYSDGTYTLRNPDKGQRIDLTASEASRLHSLLAEFLATKAQA